VLASEEGAELDGVDDASTSSAHQASVINEETACGPVSDIDDVDDPKSGFPFPLISEIAGMKLMYGRNGAPEPRKLGELRSLTFAGTAG
jgi:hypothetical protein